MENNLRFNLENNLSAWGNCLYQWATYSGLLEGLPTERTNKGILDRLKDDVKRHIPYCDAVYIIEAEQKPIDYEKEYPFGKPMELPPVICVTNLTCSQPARNKNEDGSHLSIAWFQNDFAFPIEAEIIEKIKLIPWTKVAQDFCY